MTVDYSRKGYYQVIVSEAYESTICAVKILASIASYMREQLRGANNVEGLSKKKIGYIIDSINSLTTRSKNIPQLAYTWGLPVAIINEASRLSDHRSLDIIKKTIECNTDNIDEIIRKKKEDIPPTDIGYALHLAILARTLNKLKEHNIITFNDNEAITDLASLLRITKERILQPGASGIVFESISLEVLTILSKIIPALLTTISDKYGEKSTRGGEGAICILKELIGDLNRIAGKPC